MDITCEVCLQQYTTKSRKPRFLPCGHTFCNECLLKIITKPELICPICNTSWIQVDSIDNLGINYSLLSILQPREILCTNHPSEIADCLNPHTLSALCSECSNSNKSSNLIYMDTATKWLISEAKNYLSLDIPPEYKKKVSQIKTYPNQQKFEILKELKDITNKIFCDFHADNEAIGFCLNNGEAYCQGCCRGFDNDTVDIKVLEFTETLAKRIVRLRRICNVSLIPPKLGKSYDELSALGPKELVIFYKEFLALKLSPTAVLNNTTCPGCQRIYNLNNMPMILACSGMHCVCFACVVGKNSVICPVDKSSNSVDLITPLYDAMNPLAKCSKCKENYDLKTKIPKSLPCGQIICLECLKRYYIIPNKHHCDYCNGTHASMVALSNSEFFISLIMAHIMYCSLHRNHVAVLLLPETLETMCKDCSPLSDQIKINLTGKNIVVTNVLNEIYSRKLANSEFRANVNLNLDAFSKLSNQGKIDLIREGVRPENKDSLRTKLPKGIRLDEKKVDENSEMSYLYRFYSVMPPEEVDENFRFVSKPWVIEVDKDQVEAVSFKCDRNIVLCGVGIGKGVDQRETALERIQIFKGKSMAEGQCRIETKGMKFIQKDIVEDCMLESPLEIPRETDFTILVKIKGVLIYRGNPFDLKEVQAGSDGCIFEFSEPENVGQYYVNGQHDINGPIIKLLYKLKNT
ncbi:hypothetical protein SteCoe_7012 [Stentor coeruleus]|uniref:RING-type domain-containing protein n=1 Tax=Stentor coeruleus TaxID=5963 RepID=A0A1R2CNL8_9CILI|nr:hypothetical protein SteCoe_7012 [Stentor coeruleus]